MTIIIGIRQRQPQPATAATTSPAWSKAWVILSTSASGFNLTTDPSAATGRVARTALD